MTPFEIMLWVLVFAIITALLYGIGLSKTIHRERDLMANLFAKGAHKIKVALKKNGALSEKELEFLLTGTTSSLFYSRRKMSVQDPKPFAQALLKVMVEKGILSKQQRKGRLVYCLRDCK